MKTLKSGRLAIALLAPLLASACKMSDLTAINENPNAPTAVGPQYLLTAAIQDAVSDLYGTSIDRDVTSLWVQHIARLQYGGTDRYDVTNSSFDTHWSTIYTGNLADLQLVIERSEAANLANMEAAGRTLKAWVFQHVTDLWGDIPYSQALKGHSIDRITAPAYDTQEAVYDSLLAELTLSSTMFGTGPAIGSADLIYGGDAGKWKRWSNSLRLRVAMRLSEANPAKARAAAAEAVAAGVFLSASDDAKLRYPGGSPNENPMYRAFLSRPGDYRASKTMVDTLAALADPRLGIYVDPAESNGRFTGIQNGLLDSHGIGFTTVSKVGIWFLSPATPAMLQSYAEVSFLKAEAAARGWITGNPAQFYAEGIRSSMQRYGISEAAITAYLAQPRVAYSPATGMTQILLQKWIDLYDQGPEAYAEWRRTGVPNLRPTPANVNSNVIPRRFTYPTTEDARNRASVEAARARAGGNAMSVNTPVWWDQ